MFLEHNKDYMYKNSLHNTARETQTRTYLEKFHFEIGSTGNRNWDLFI